MGDIAAFPQYSNGSYSDEELRQIARTMYCSGGDRHLKRIAHAVGKDIETIKRWQAADNWILARTAALQSKKDSRLSKIEEMLKAAGIKTEQESALDTLRICDTADKLIKTCLSNHAGERQPYPEYLDKAFAVVERIEKVRKGAFGRL